MLSDLLQNCIDGLMIGSGYALLALGFTMVFGVMKCINLSYGPSIMLGAYAGTWLYLNVEQNAWFVLLGTIAGTVLVGIYVERLCFRSLNQDSTIASMVSSFVIWMQLEEIAMHILPERTYPFPDFFTVERFEFGEFYVRSEHLTMFLVVIILVVMLHYFLFSTRLGLAVRAVSDNPLASLYMGINRSITFSIAFLIASILGGISGFLILSSDTQITPFFGLWATFKGLLAMMIGGMGSLVGAIIGGLVLGVVEANVFWYGDPILRDLSAYMLLFLILIFRPGGIMGNSILQSQDAAKLRV